MRAACGKTITHLRPENHSTNNIGGRYALGARYCAVSAGLLHLGVDIDAVLVGRYVLAVDTEINVILVEHLQG